VIYDESEAASLSYLHEAHEACDVLAALSLANMQTEDIQEAEEGNASAQYGYRGFR
jgi:hypothetical protein